jgi:four helix bundle protein
MSIESEQLKQRTMQFALDVLRLVDTFPRSTAGDLVGRQLAKSATSVAANYRATCVARSRAEFIAKLGVVFEESDESEFWLDVSPHQASAIARKRTVCTRNRSNCVQSLAGLWEPRGPIPK